MPRFSICESCVTPALRHGDPDSRECRLLQYVRLWDGAVAGSPTLRSRQGISGLASGTPRSRTTDELREAVAEVYRDPLAAG